MDIISAFEADVARSNRAEGTPEQTGTQGPQKMKKSLLLFFLVLVFVPIIALAQEGIVTCGNGATGCTIEDFFGMLGRIYNFIVKQIAAPLAIIAITVGGILMLISAGNPNLMSLGKKIFYVAIIGLVLVLCSWLIIDFILGALGYKYKGSWSSI